MTQLVFHISLNPQNVGSNTSEGIELSERENRGKEGEHSSSTSLYMQRAGDVTGLKMYFYTSHNLDFKKKFLLALKALVKEYPNPSQVYPVA